MSFDPPGYAYLHAGQGMTDADNMGGIRRIGRNWLRTVGACDAMARDHVDNRWLVCRPSDAVNVASASPYAARQRAGSQAKPRSGGGKACHIPMIDRFGPVYRDPQRGQVDSAGSALGR